MKRALALLLTLCLCVSLAACGGTGSTTTSAAATTAATEETQSAASTQTAEAASSEATAESPEASASNLVISYPLFDEPTTFTLWTSNSPDLSEIVSDLNTYVVFDQLEKITNVKWDATLVSFFSADEKFQLMVASQEYTDVVNRAVDSYAGGMDQAVDEEFLINLSDLIDENMPNLQSWLNKFPELRKQMTSVGGNICAFPKIYKEVSDVTSGGCIRQDWLDDLNLAMPTTYDEMHDVLTAFKDQKNAKYPLTVAVSTGVQPELLAGYNIASGFYQVDGTVMFGAMQPAFKDYLTMLNQWYEEGLVWPDFITQQSDNLMDTSNILNGATGIWYGTGVQTITNLMSQATDPNMNVTGFTNVTTDGSQAHIGEEGQVFDSNMWSITTECKDPASICKYIDYIYGDDGILLANYGVEGETFNYDASGTPVLTELVTNNPDYSYSLALNIYTCDRQTPIPFVVDEDKSRADYSDAQKSAVAAWNKNTDGLYNLPRFGINMTTEETTAYNAKYDDIDTFMDEAISKFITGDTSLDQFDAYVAQLKSMGIEDCIALEQTAYDRYQNS